MRRAGGHLRLGLRRRGALAQGRPLRARSVHEDVRPVQPVAIAQTPEKDPLHEQSAGEFCRVFSRTRLKNSFFPRARGQWQVSPRWPHPRATTGWPVALPIGEAKSSPPGQSSEFLFWRVPALGARCPHRHVVFVNSVPRAPIRAYTSLSMSSFHYLATLIGSATPPRPTIRTARPRSPLRLRWALGLGGLANYGSHGFVGCTVSQAPTLPAGGEAGGSPPAPTLACQGGGAWGAPSFTHSYSCSSSSLSANKDVHMRDERRQCLFYACEWEWDREEPETGRGESDRAVEHRLGSYLIVNSGIRESARYAFSSRLDSVPERSVSVVLVHTI